MAKEVSEKVKEIAEKYGINLDGLRAEQLRLKKNLELKDKFDPEDIMTYAGCDTAFFDNSIVAVIVVTDTNM